MDCDSSDFAVGGVISQLQDGAWRPLAFLSKSLSPAERNYEVYDKELLAVMTCLGEWRHYLLGAPEPFELWSDHLNLQYFQQPQNINQRQARWVSDLADYDFVLHHLPRKSNSAADALSQLSCHDNGFQNNQRVQVLKDSWFKVRATETLEDWV